jgi:hypothetical protein
MTNRMHNLSKRSLLCLLGNAFAEGQMMSSPPDAISYNRIVIVFPVLAQVSIHSTSFFKKVQERLLLRHWLILYEDHSDIQACF